jgi:transcriptional regulator with XRE-family HTH domain
MPIGALVRLYRMQRRMSTVSLATHAGITVRYLEMIEGDSKTPSVPVLRKLAKVLGVRTSALLGEPPSEDHEGRSILAWQRSNGRCVPIAHWR